MTDSELGFGAWVCCFGLGGGDASEVTRGLNEKRESTPCKDERKCDEIMSLESDWGMFKS